MNKNATPDVTLKSELLFSNITPTVAHVHEGAAESTGPIVFDPAGYTLGASTGSLDITLTPSQVSLYDSDSLYINLHTAVNPAGELRGQIRP